MTRKGSKMKKMIGLQTRLLVVVAVFTAVIIGTMTWYSIYHLHFLSGTALNRSHLKEAVLQMVSLGVVGGSTLIISLTVAIHLLLLRPLRRIETATKSITEGDLSMRVEIERVDEMGLLAASFNEMAKSLQERYQASITDELTGLYNHLYFKDKLAEELERAVQFNRSFGLLVCDIDDFKLINEEKGHRFGDTVLQNVGMIVKESVRDIDLCARYAGEEFGVVLTEASPQTAYAVAERIRRAVAGMEFGDGLWPVTVSIGVALFPDDGATVDELLWKADQAKVIAKDGGRNQVQFYCELKDTDAPPNELQKLRALKEAREQAIISSIDSLAAAVEVRDSYTHSHSETVGRHSAAIAAALGLGKDEIKQISVGGLLHDVGKIGVPDNILRKPGPLDDQEWVKMKEHPRLGKIIVQHIKSLDKVLPYIEYHQERFDGSGYPDGLKGEAIPLGARIIAIADAYHSMTSSRPYRPVPMECKQAVLELKRCRGTHFDPQLVDVFIQLLEQQGAANQN